MAIEFPEDEVFEEENIESVVITFLGMSIKTFQGILIIRKYLLLAIFFTWKIFIFYIDEMSINNTLAINFFINPHIPKVLQFI